MQPGQTSGIVVQLALWCPFHWHTDCHTLCWWMLLFCDCLSDSPLWGSLHGTVLITPEKCINNNIGNNDEVKMRNDL